MILILRTYNMVMVVFKENTHYRLTRVICKYIPISIERRFEEEKRGLVLQDEINPGHFKRAGDLK